MKRLGRTITGQPRLQVIRIIQYLKGRCDAYKTAADALYNMLRQREKEVDLLMERLTYYEQSFQTLEDVIRNVNARIREEVRGEEVTPE